MRYTVCVIRANIEGPRYELLDTSIDGGEDQPLIVARFYERELADRVCGLLNEEP